MKNLFLFIFFILSLQIHSKDKNTSQKLEELLNKGSYENFFKNVSLLDQNHKSQIRRMLIRGQLETGKYLAAAQAIKNNPLLENLFIVKLFP